MTLQSTGETGQFLQKDRVSFVANAMCPRLSPTQNHKLGHHQHLFSPRSCLAPKGESRALRGDQVRAEGWLVAQGCRKFLLCPNYLLSDWWITRIMLGSRASSMSCGSGDSKKMQIHLQKQAWEWSWRGRWRRPQHQSIPAQFHKDLLSLCSPHGFILLCFY